MNVLQYDAGLALEIAKEFGEERGRAKMLIENIDAGMQNFHVSLQEACQGLGYTVEKYEEAKELIKPKKRETLFLLMMLTGFVIYVRRERITGELGAGWT